MTKIARWAAPSRSVVRGPENVRAESTSVRASRITSDGYDAHDDRLPGHEPDAEDDREDDAHRRAHRTPGRG